jgi:hypothetical protein
MQNQTSAAPKRVLLLDSFLSAFFSFGGDFSPWAEFTKTRMELDAARFVHRHPCVASGQIPRWRDLADSA